jgi:hypothetical protein
MFCTWIGDPDNLTAISTATIALFTIVLVIVGYVQARLVRRTVDLTRQELALARDEFLATHRPKIKIKHVWLTSPLQHTNPIIIKVVCVNAGTSSAILTEFAWGVLVRTKEHFLPVNYEWKNKAVINRPELNSGINYHLPGITYTLSKDQLAAISSGHSKLYCIGYIHYADRLGNVRTTAFCRELQLGILAGSYRFIVPKDADPDYEYDY